MEKLQKITSNLNPDEVWNSNKILDEMKEEELVSLIEGCEFDVYKKPNGKYKVVDFQEANLGGIEEEEFDTILDIALRMYDTYFIDYYEF